MAITNTTKIRHSVGGPGNPTTIANGTIYFRKLSNSDDRYEMLLSQGTRVNDLKPISSIVKNNGGLESAVFGVGDTMEQALAKVQQAIKNTLVIVKQNNTDVGSFRLNQDSTSSITINLKDTTYDVATSSKAGLMSAGDKTKLDSINTGVVNDVYIIPAGEIKIGEDFVIDTSDCEVRSETGQQYTFGDPSGNAPWTFHGVADKAIYDGNGNVIATSYPKLENGKIPTEYLPGSVDEILEYNSMSVFPTKGESGKIYVDKTTNKTYRWGETQYVEISASLAIGTGENMAYKGSEGAALATKVANILNGTTTVPKATNATNATNDKNGADISTTYLKKASDTPQTINSEIVFEQDVTINGDGIYTENSGASIGTGSKPFDNVYANSFHGNLDGKASEASKIGTHTAESITAIGSKANAADTALTWGTW